MPNFIDVMDRLDMMDRKLNAIIHVVEVVIEKGMYIQLYSTKHMRIKENERT